MYSTVLFGLLASSVIASSVSENNAAMLKRHAIGTTGTCAVQPAGNAQPTTPDTVDNFLNNVIYAAAANDQKLPAGYTQTCKNQHASVIDPEYYTYEIIPYTNNYNADYCAARCSNEVPGCQAFNIYFERSPSLDPGDACPDPTSVTYIKCAYYLEPITQSEATNDGQYCADFHLVIAGSNCYNVDPSSSTTTTTTTTVSATTSSAASTTTSSTLSTTTTTTVSATTSSAASTTTSSTLSTTTTTAVSTTASTTSSTTTKAISTTAATSSTTTSASTTSSASSTTTPKISTTTSKFTTTSSTKTTTTPYTTPTTMKTTTKSTTTCKTTPSASPTPISGPQWPVWHW